MVVLWWEPIYLGLHASSTIVRYGRSAPCRFIRPSTLGEITSVLIPKYTRGENRKPNPTYVEVRNALKRACRRGDRAAVRQLRKQQRSLPSGDPQDPDYRRLHYARYADDQLLGFTGPKAEAEQIKARLTAFL